MNEMSVAREAGEFLAQLSDSAVAAFSDSELLQKVPFVSHIAKAFAVKVAYHRHRLARNCRGPRSDASAICSDCKWT